MKPQPKYDWRRVYEAAATRRQLQEEEYQKGDGLGGCLCILVVTVLAVIVYSALFFCWI
tara:strand:+ start:2963 stop:3139 length:177 start_codon:yes stop_codon:yes gene_type:complete